MLSLNKNENRTDDQSSSASDNWKIVGAAMGAAGATLMTMAGYIVYQLVRFPFR